EQGAALQLTIRTDIEGHRRRLGARATVPTSLQPGHVDTRRSELRSQSVPAAVVALRDGVELRHPPWGSGRRIGLGLPSGVEGVDAHPMTCDVVRMRIEAARWLGNHDARSERADDPHQPA